MKKVTMECLEIVFTIIPEQHWNARATNMYKPFFVRNTPTLYTKMDDTPNRHNWHNPNASSVTWNPSKIKTQQKQRCVSTSGPCHKNGNDAL